MKALITGASSGIGRDMAIYLSDLGYDLILVARRRERLIALKRNLTTNIKIFSIDLSIIENNYKLYNELKNENIDIIINNAGCGLLGEFINTDLDKELNMINLNIISPHILTKLFLKDFYEKNEGYILNVCSSGGFLSGPLISTYYSTKNYLLKLTMAIYQELKINKSNVKISALCPGPVKTEFNSCAQSKNNLKEIDSKYIAKYAINKLFQQKMLIIPQFKIRCGLLFMKIIPYKLQLLITYLIQTRKIKPKN